MQKLQLFKKATIDNPSYLDHQDTQDLFHVKTLGPLINKTAHLKERRGHLDKIQKYAMDKFGYQAEYIKGNRQPHLQQQCQQTS